MSRSRPRAGGIAVALAIALALPAVQPSEAFASAAHVGPAAACKRPDVPIWFHRSLATAIHVSRDLPPSWAGSPYLAKLVCWQGTDFSVTFRRASAGYHVWHGLFAMTIEEMQTVGGQWLTRTRGGYELSTPCFVR